MIIMSQKQQGQQGRRGRLQYTGTSKWIKLDSFGNVVDEKEVDEFEKPVGRTEHFFITYLTEIIALIDSLGNKKMQVVKYMLKHMNRSNNTLIITTRELAIKANVGYNTAIETLQILDDAGIIQRRTGAIMINPRLLNNKRAQGEANMLIHYKEFGDDNEEYER